MCIYLSLFTDLSSDPCFLYQDLQAQLWVLSVLRTLGFKEAEMFSLISAHSQTWSLRDLHRVLFYISLNSYFVPPSTYPWGFIFLEVSPKEGCLMSRLLALLCHLIQGFFLTQDPQSGNQQSQPHGDMFFSPPIKVVYWLLNSQTPV